MNTASPEMKIYDDRKVCVTVNAPTFVVPAVCLADFIATMSRFKVRSGYGASATIEPVEFSLDYSDVPIAAPKTPRELALEKERDQRARWWQEESAKVAKLKEEIRVL